MKLLKRFMILAFLCIFFTSMQACESENTIESQHAPLNYNQTYTIGVKANGYETKGKMSIDRNHKLYFHHEAPDSALFGMEEWADEETYEARYKGIEWKTTEVVTETVRLQRIVSVILSNDPHEKSTDSQGGIAAKKHTYQTESGSIVLWVDKKNQNPIKIQASENGRDYEINFYQESSPNESITIK